jgi:flavodoxin
LLFLFCGDKARFMKKILVIYFTQSGQLKQILQSLTKPLSDAGHQIHFEEIKPVEKFPFPWNAFQFFNAFPETFTQKTQALEPASAKAYENYDLVILGYQPWFLTPSRPVSSFLQSEAGKKILAGKTVVTVLGCRNMWLGAQEKVKHWLLQANAKLIAHIAMIDHSGNLTSLVTILRWMLTGKKEAFWFFPEAGVAKNDVANAHQFGSIIKNSLEESNYTTLQKELNDEGAIEIKPNLVLMERRGQKSFSVWAKFVAGGGSVQSTGRKIRVYVFMYLLPTVIFILTPLLWLLSQSMLIIKRKHLLEEIEYFKQTSLRNTGKTV